jgi:hypothetical protein
LPIVRFDPDAGTGETVAIWAERLDTGQREPGQLNSRADPHLIYRFSSPAPDLPGGWYMFQQALPSAGCWRLSAAINGRVVGTAVVEIGGSLSPSPEPSGAPTPHVAGAPVSSCAGGSWPATVISCDSVFRLGNQAGAQVDRARIWLTTLDAVKASMHPFEQVIEPAAHANVWVIVYDGSWWCCTNAFDQNGNLIPQVHQTRWLVVAEAAATAGAGYIYLQDWTGKTVPDLLPAP